MHPTNIPGPAPGTSWKLRQVPKRWPIDQARDAETHWAPQCGEAGQAHFDARRPSARERPKDQVHVCPASLEQHRGTCANFLLEQFSDHSQQRPLRPSSSHWVCQDDQEPHGHCCCAPHIFFLHLFEVLLFHMFHVPDTQCSTYFNFFELKCRSLADFPRKCDGSILWFFNLRYLTLLFWGPRMLDLHIFCVGIMFQNSGFLGSMFVSLIFSWDPRCLIFSEDFLRTVHEIPLGTVGSVREVARKAGA